MIISFGNQIARDLFYDRTSRVIQKFPQDLLRVARRKILYLHDADKVYDLKAPPGDRLESLKGEFKGHYSIRINDRWRVVFKWSNGAEDVKVLYYHS